MNPRLVTLGLVVVLVGAATYSFVYFSDSAVPTQHLPSHFTVGGRDFPITYVATTQLERQVGLMNKSITDTTAMLFIFPQSGYYSFWMYDTSSSLDIMWLNVKGGTGSVVYIVRDAPSCYNALQCATYNPTAQANYVLEAKAGFAVSNNVTVGTTVALG